MCKQIFVLILLCGMLPPFVILEAQPRYTGLWGYCDRQNSNTPQALRLEPLTGMLYTVMTIALDSLYPEAGRITSFAQSSNAGVSWASALIFPRALYPGVDLCRGSFTGHPVIVDRSADQEPRLFVCDATGWPVGVVPPPSLGNVLMLSPAIASAEDGSVTLAASVQYSGSTGFRLIQTRTEDWTSWSPWLQAPATDAGGVTVASGSAGLLGVVVEGNEGIFLWQSTDHGATWGTALQTIVPRPFIIGSDTFAHFRSMDLVYRGNEPMVAFTFTRLVGGEVYTHRHAGVGFWSPSTGFVFAVPHSAVPGVTDSLGRPQADHLTVGYPSIGIAGTTLVIVFVAFQPEVSAAGFNFGEIFLTSSTDGGATWTTPENVSATSGLDERYPSVAKWNGPSAASIVWQEDREPGSSLGDGAPGSSARQVYRSWPLQLNGVDVPASAPTDFVLEQNYPNPFNGTTTIKFALPEPSNVSLEIYNLLGQRVTTLARKQFSAGLHKEYWDGTASWGQRVGSGVYLVRFDAHGAEGNNFTDVRKLILLR